MANEDKTLHDIRNHMFDKAEAIWRWSFIITVCVKLILLFVVFSKHPAVMLIAGFISLTVPFITKIMQSQASFYTGRGDKVRRLVLYSESLGKEINPDGLKIIKAWVFGDQVKQAPFEGEYFFDPSKDHGPAKLAANTKESAYFTNFLAGKMADIFLWVLIASGFIIATIVYFGFAFATPGNISSISSLVLGLAAFLLGGDIFMYRLKYKSLAEKASDVYKRCSRFEGMKDTDPYDALYDVMNVVEDYNSALINSPPIPFKLYQKYNNELNKAYRADQPSEDASE